MRGLSLSLLLVAATVLASGPAAACLMHVQFKPKDAAALADLVVLGEIEDYRLVKELASPLEDFAFARFDIRVAEVLQGEAPERVSAFWVHHMGVPEALAPGPYLIGLLKPESPELDRSSHPHDDTMGVFHRSCSQPFLLSPESREAQAVREALKAAD